MADNPRIEDLRRRIQKDPASIAFAQLAEEYRRAGEIEEAVRVCRAGLAIHPGYLSARVTLGRALIEANQLEEAQHELEIVLKSAPENLAAIRGLADIFHRRGDLAEALDQYRLALGMARNDPDLEHAVSQLAHELGPATHVPAPPLPVPYRPPLPVPAAEPPKPAAIERPAAEAPSVAVEAPLPPPERPVVAAEVTIAPPTPPVPPVAVFEAPPPAPESPSPEHLRADRTVAALERFLDAVHVARAHLRS